MTNIFPTKMSFFMTTVCFLFVFSKTVVPGFGQASLQETAGEAERNVRLTTPTVDGNIK